MSDFIFYLLGTNTISRLINGSASFRRSSYFRSFTVFWNKGFIANLGQLNGWTAQPSEYAVEVMDEEDIIAAVNFARNFNLRLVVKGTGEVDSILVSKIFRIFL